MEATFDHQAELFPNIEEKVRKRNPFRRYLDLSREHGGLATQAMIAEALGVTRSRVGQFVNEGRLTTVEALGRRWVTVSSFEMFLTEERKNGRPLSKEPSLGSLVKTAFDATWRK
jgi:predicted XRE-type DNA-binding protein